MEEMVSYDNIWTIAERNFIDICSAGLELYTDPEQCYGSAYNCSGNTMASHYDLSGQCLVSK